MGRGTPPESETGADIKTVLSGLYRKHLRQLTMNPILTRFLGKQVQVLSEETAPSKTGHEVLVIPALTRATTPFNLEYYTRHLKQKLEKKKKK